MSALGLSQRLGRLERRVEEQRGARRIGGVADPRKELWERLQRLSGRLDPNRRESADTEGITRRVRELCG